MNTLNPRQQQAIKNISTPLLVLAGAGSGKTSVITQKIAHLITNCHIAPHKIMAVTFTNKAAREMKQRVNSLIPRTTTRGLIVSTFHNLGLNIIRREHQHLDLKPGFSIFDGQDSLALIKDLMQRESVDDSGVCETIQHSISNWKNDLLSPEQILSQVNDDSELLAARVYAAYNRLLRAYNAVDFDDLILLPTNLFLENKNLREKWQNKVHYLLVDEYQDTNHSQYLLIKLLVGIQARFTVVGDDDQSIYSWRGANPENLSLLKTDFPTLEVVMLEQNYRSSGRILKAANRLIANNPHIFEKSLWCDLGFGDPIRVVRQKNEDQEADFVAHDMMTHKLRKGLSWSDFAILYRGNFQSRIIELKLQALGVPYKVSGGTAFFSRAEVKDIMAYLRLMINPDDDNAFLRIVNTPRREIGTTTLEKLGTYAGTRHISLFAATQEIGIESILPKRNLEKVRDFSQWITDVGQLCRQRSPITIIKQMITEIDYPAWLNEQSTSPAVAERRLENVWQLVGSIENMLQDTDNLSSGEDPIENVISRLILRDILEQQEADDDSDRVQLMTLHASKGLEFPHVYLTGMEEELLPHRASIEEGNIEEERRLTYVGITRAQKTLTMTLSATRKQYGQAIECTPSRFLDELPKEDLDWHGMGIERSEEEKNKIAKSHLSGMRELLR
ncbi:MAG: DNA helicase Rep [Pseudomonadales bacterium]|nr:DNA helicase Rep [Pseudomonadales bacterium]